MKGMSKSPTTKRKHRLYVDVTFSSNLTKRDAAKGSSIDIRLSKSADGTYTASTSAEPLFCFCRKTPDELAKVVAGTLVSYVENFWDGGEVEITFFSVFGILTVSVSIVVFSKTLRS